jgi:membrane protease YdiL (CAAX protease family)
VTESTPDPPGPIRPSAVAEADRLGRRWMLVCTALVLGAVLVGATLRFDRGSAGFYVAGYLLAGVWIGASLLATDQRAARRALFDVPTEITGGVVVGAVMFVVFVVGAAAGRQFSVLAGPIDHILRTADGGSLAAVMTLALVNGVAEELFFRGVLVDALAARRERSTRDVFVWSTVVYVVVTSVAGNTALTLAAVVMGAVFAAERWYTRSLVAPVVTHLVWSTLMILVFPR